METHAADSRANCDLVDLVTCLKGLFKDGTLPSLSCRSQDGRKVTMCPLSDPAKMATLMVA